MKSSKLVLNRLIPCIVSMARLHHKSICTVCMLIFMASFGGAAVFGFISENKVKENDVLVYFVTAAINTIQSWLGVQLFLHIEESNRLQVDSEL